MLETVTFEEGIEETFECEEGCGKADLTEDDYYSDYHGRWAGYYCDDCLPRCYCPDCDPDYYNDIAQDR